MSERERVYYRVGAKSPVMEVIRKAEQRHRAFHKVCNALRREYAPAKIWICRQRFAGIEFPKEPPPGWRPTKRGVYAVPDKRILAGRALAARFDQLPSGIDAWSFSTLMCALEAGYTHYDDNRAYFTVFEKYGDTYILSVPEGAKVAPPACTKLKTSAYWKIREASK